MTAVTTENEILLMLTWLEGEIDLKTFILVFTLLSLILSFLNKNKGLEGEKCIVLCHSQMRKFIKAQVWVCPSLCFKARLREKLLIWKSFLFSCKLNLYSVKKGFALSLVLKVTFFWNLPMAYQNITCR